MIDDKLHTWTGSWKHFMETRVEALQQSAFSTKRIASFILPRMTSTGAYSVTFMWCHLHLASQRVTQLSPFSLTWLQNEPEHVKTNKMTCALGKVSVHPDWSQSSLCTLRVAQVFFMRRVKTVIGLGGCPGWCEASLGTQVILLVLSYSGSNL